MAVAMVVDVATRSVIATATICDPAEQLSFCLEGAKLHAVVVVVVVVGSSCGYPKCYCYRNCYCLLLSILLLSHPNT